MFARVLITLRMSVLLLTLTENLATPRLCASTSTSPLATRVETAATPTCAAAAIPVPTHTPPWNAPSRSSAAQTRPQDRVTAGKSKVEQQRHNHKPLVSSPIDIYHLELKLATHLIETLYTCIICLVRSRRVLLVSTNLISAAQHTEVVSLNLQIEGKQ